MNFKLNIAFVLFLIFLNSVHSQQIVIDSLKEVKTTNENERVDYLNELSRAYLDLKVLDSSRIFAIEAVDMAKKIEYFLGAGDAYYNIGATSFESSDFRETEEISKRAINYFKNIGSEKKLAESYVLLGRAIWAQSRFEEAKENFEKANALLSNLNDSIALGKTYGLIALAEEERGNYETSFEYCMKAQKFDKDAAFMSLGQLYADVGDYTTALNFFRLITDKKLEGYADLKIGETYFLQKNYKIAKRYYENYIDSVGNFSKHLLSKPNTLLGELYLETNDYEKALFYLNPALENFEKMNNRNWVMRVLLDLGKTYRHLGNTDLAISQSTQLLRFSEESGARQYTRDAHYLLFQLYEHINKRDSSYVHLKKFTELKNAIDIHISARKLAFYKTTNEKNKAEYEINLLNKQKELQQEALKQSAQQKRFLFIGIIALVIFGLFSVRNILLKKRNVEHLKELSDNNLRMQKLETKKLLGEMEMQILRTQMNPHFIFNSLNSINRFILKNSTLEASEYLTKFSRLVRMILQNSQNKLIYLEEELKYLELYLNLEALRFDNHFTYTITYDDNLDVKALKVPPLIIQPYSENAVWHGLMNKKGKGHLDIAIWREDALLYIKVTDDGVGRDKAAELAGKPTANHISMGLEITSKRIAMIQGAHSSKKVVAIHDLVDSFGTPCGTEVVIKLPEIYD